VGVGRNHPSQRVERVPRLLACELVDGFELG
jgi:hypothetical protein